MRCLVNSVNRLRIRNDHFDDFGPFKILDYGMNANENHTSGRSGRKLLRPAIPAVS